VQPVSASSPVPSAYSAGAVKRSKVAAISLAGRGVPLSSHQVGTPREGADRVFGQHLDVDGWPAQAAVALNSNG
jgi:hypothetical protein